MPPADPRDATAAPNSRPGGWTHGPDGRGQGGAGEGVQLLQQGGFRRQAAGMEAEFLHSPSPDLGGALLQGGRGELGGAQPQTARSAMAHQVQVPQRFPGQGAADLLDRILLGIEHQHRNTGLYSLGEPLRHRYTGIDHHQITLDRQRRGRGRLPLSRP